MIKFVRHYAWACIAAVSGFFLLLVGVDHLLYTQQSTHLQAVYRTYADLGGTSSVAVRLAKDNHVTITRLTGKPQTQREDLLQDLVDRKRTIIDESTVLLVSGRPEQIYVGGRDNIFVGVWQKKATLFGVAPQLGLAFVVLYAAGCAALATWILRRNRYWHGHVAQMAHNVAAIRREHPVEPIIASPGSPFAELTREIERLDQTAAHLRQKVALRQASFDRLIDHLPQGVMLIDTDRAVLLANPAMQQFVGHEISPRQHNYLDDVKTYALARLIEHTYRSRKSHHQEVTLMTTQKAVDANVIALTGTDRLQVLVILYDVSYLRQVEQMQLDFVGNVSHELKTPVTAISGFTETLLDGAKNDPATLDQFLTIIHDESLRLTQLIQDILTLSRPEAAQANAVVNVRDLVQRALQPLQAPVAAKHLRIDIEVPTDLTVTTVPAKLSQVVRNLLNNAVFYNREGGSITITAAAAATGWQLAVADTGIGIREEDQARVFERFYRVDKARSRHNGGTGLGLAIVHEMVQQLQGELHLKSQVGVGSRFTVTLPNAGA
ncbi:two-component system histidine kinase PnpS [Lacticaseibacillus parakribbianus]|uniref:two-component system histidine kinase PnpS n=1 Tax=Lacticaseibacillus parakribbianus TaxID=2970927 RepID=UPI0021CB5420|nr:ATP-binding protein [Lacticaseibacillus parakribbianus]